MLFVQLAVAASPLIIPGYEATFVPGVIAPKRFYQRTGVVSEDGKFWFIPRQMNVHERQSRDGSEAFLGEDVLTLVGSDRDESKVFTHITSQGNISRYIPEFTGSLWSARALASTHSDRLLMKTTAVSRNGKVRFDGVSEVNFRARGYRPHWDATFPSTGNGAVDVLMVRPAKRGWDLLVSRRVPPTSRRVSLLAYHFESGRLRKVGTMTSFGKLPSSVLLPSTTSIDSLRFAIVDAVNPIASAEPTGRTSLSQMLARSSKRIPALTDDVYYRDTQYLGGVRFVNAELAGKHEYQVLVLEHGKWIHTSASRILAVSGSGNYVLVEGKQGDLWMMKRVAGPTKTR